MMVLVCILSALWRVWADLTLGLHVLLPGVPAMSEVADSVAKPGAGAVRFSNPSTEGPAYARPSMAELHMIGAQHSVSFKKSTSKHGLVRPLSTLPPFVPRLLKEDLAYNDAKYRSFDASASRELSVASKTLEASIVDFPGSVMIADVKGFTALTEILSKKGVWEC
jgi:hypothetical protein